MTADRRRDNLLRLAEVKARSGLSRTTIYNRMDAGTFPPCLRISAGLVAWYESDIDAWVAAPMDWRDTTPLAA
jgi:prophage regulatory protein